MHTIIIVDDGGGDIIYGDREPRDGCVNVDNDEDNKAWPESPFVLVTGSE